MPDYRIAPGSELDKALDEMVEMLHSGTAMDPQRARLIDHEDEGVIKALGIRGLKLMPGARVHESVDPTATWYGGLKDE